MDSAGNDRHDDVVWSEEAFSGEPQPTAKRRKPPVKKVEKDEGRTGHGAGQSQAQGKKNLIKLAKNLNTRAKGQGSSRSKDGRIEKDGGRPRGAPRP
jgi:hypothetical protein